MLHLRGIADNIIAKDAELATVWQQGKEKSSGAHMIFDAEKQTLWMIDDKDKSYTVLDKATLDEMAKQLDQVDSRMKEAMATVSWFIDKAVFFRTTPKFPDTFYRSNWIPGQMFIDEPSVRLGWSGDIPVKTSGPEQVADLVRELQSVARDSGQERPLLVAVDQEGSEGS